MVYEEYGSPDVLELREIAKPAVRDDEILIKVQAASVTPLDLKELLETGKMTPVIDRRYPLNEVPEALRYIGKGHARGKIIITLV